MKSLKSLIFGMPIILASCFTIHGSFDVAYVPRRTGYELNMGEIKVAGEIRGEIPTSKDSALYAGYIHSLYLSLQGGKGTTIYEMFCGWKNPNFNVYMKNRTRTKEMIFYDNNEITGSNRNLEDWTGMFITNYESIEMGVKVEW